MELTRGEILPLSPCPPIGRHRPCPISGPGHPVRHPLLDARRAPSRRTTAPTSRRCRIRLLEAMFASDDVCQQSLQTLEDVAGISRKHIQRVLRGLLAAGVIVKEDTGAGRHANRYRLLLTVGNGA